MCSSDLFMSMAAEAEITVTPGPDGPEIGLAIGEIDPLVAQVTYISDNLKGAEGFMTMIIQAVLLPSIAKSFAEKSLANFALPAFDISSLSPMLPGGIVWKFVVDKFYRQLGYTSMQAHIENK